MRLAPPMVAALLGFAPLALVQVQPALAQATPGQTTPGQSTPGQSSPGQGTPPPGTPPQGAVPADDPSQSPAPPALSRECQTPGVRISGEVPLPHVTLALRQRKIIKILTVGASSKGGKAGADRGYQSIIEAMVEKTVPGVDVKIIDRGFSGELARDAAERIKTEIALEQPDLLLWQLGTHDALMHVQVEDFKATVGDTLDWLREHNVDVVMVGLHYLRQLVPDKHYQSIRSTLREVAEAKKVLWIGRYEAMQVIEQARRTGTGPSPNEFTMTDNGYACLSEYVVRALTSGAFARPPRQLPPRG